MKNNTERNEHIFLLFSENNMSIKEIAQIEFDSALSLKNIRDIVYGCNRRNWKNDKKIYSLFFEKFLEFQDTNHAIKYVFENQPKHRLSYDMIRRIINRQLKERAKRAKRFNQKFQKPKQQFVPDYSDCHGY